MSRGIGELAPIQEIIPEWMAVVIALLTQFGDIWFLLLVLALLYWTQVDRQDEIALVGGTLVAGIGLYRTLKYVFELPRPDQPLLNPELLPALIRPFYEATAFASSYGFPSGHATTSAIVYFGLATVFTVSTRRVRFATAGVVVGIVSFSRLALGLHFLIDVVVGTILGSLFLFISVKGLERVPTDRISVLLVIAIALNGLYAATSGISTESVFALGAALGMSSGWQLIVLARRLVAIDIPSKAIRPLLLRGGFAAVTFAPLLFALEEFPLLAGEPYPLGGLVGVAASIVVIVPITRHSQYVRQGGTAIRFWLSALGRGLRKLFRPST